MRVLEKYGGLYPCGLHWHQAGYTGQKAGRFATGYAQIILAHKLCSLR
ncbi:hypothetical protein ACFOS1_13840 [Zunongwangia endophytica]|uniref:Uncharacterized protein n=1 Tax=Zunongwangia endophytica TaxID=1808945 RepID=A0ABV8H979_9FLAO